MSQADLGQGTIVEGAKIKHMTIGGLRFASTTRVSATTHALTINSAPMQYIEPTAAQIVTLPAEEDSAGCMVIICNIAATAGLDLTINNDGGTAVADLLSAVTTNAREMCILVCDGITWRGLTDVHT